MAKQHFTKNFKLFLAIDLFILYSSLCLAQLPTDVTHYGRELKLVEFTSPAEWSFHKYIENPIGLYKGCPNVEVPLFTLKDGSIELPISLRYNTSGIKVEEEASWVGLGWNLNIGGYITKQIVDGEDERDYTFSSYKNIFYKNNSTIDTYGSIVIDENAYNTIAHYRQDTPEYIRGKLAPDVYYFSYPENSGRYVVDYRDSTICLLEREKDILIYNFEGDEIENKDKTIITEDGIKHCFSHYGSAYEYGTYNPISETFALTYTYYPDNSYVHYLYTKYSVSKNVNSVYTIGTIPETSGSSPLAYKAFLDRVQHQVSRIVTDECVPNEIRTPNYLISFVTSSRNDLANAPQLTEIIIKDRHNGSYLKRFRFSYDYFTNSSSDSMDSKRLKLCSVYEVHPNDTSIVENRYSFNYIDTPLPGKKSYSYDHWGYPNSSNSIDAANPMPDLSDFDEIYQDIEHISLAARQGSNVYSKRHNVNYCQAGMLSSITYPTGGRTHFEYESNSFTNVPIPSNNRIYNRGEGDVSSETIKDQNSSTDTRSVVITTTGTRTFKIEYHINKGNNSWEDMSGSYIVMVNTSTGSVNTLVDMTEKCAELHASSSPSGYYSGVRDITVPAGSYAFNINLPDSLGDQNGSSLNHGSFIANISYEDIDSPDDTVTDDSQSYGCGMRIASIQYFDGKATAPVMVKRYNYDDPHTGLSSGILFDTPLYFKTYRVGYKYENGMADAIMRFTYARQFEVFDKPVQNNPYGRSSGVGYTYVTETTDGIPGKTQYCFYNESTTDQMLSYRVGGIMNGRLKSKIIYDDNDDIQSSAHYNFTYQLSHSYYGVNLINMACKFPSLVNNTESGWIRDNVFAYYQDAFIAILYNLNTYDITLASETLTKDGVTTTTNYTYDPVTLLIKQKTTQMSNGNQLKTRYKYPKDINDYPYITLYDKHILTPIIEEQTTNSGALIYSRLAEINSFGNINALYYGEDLSQNISGISSGGIVNTSIYPHCTQECLRRDSRQNPIHYKLNETEDLIYIWGYGGRYPVAEIKGASYAEVQTALDCTPELLSVATFPDFTLLESMRTSLPNASVTLYKYDMLGNIIEVTDPRGHSTVYEYDSFCRLVKIKRKNGSSYETLESFNYNTVK